MLHFLAFRNAIVMIAFSSAISFQLSVEAFVDGTILNANMSKDKKNAIFEVGITSSYANSSQNGKDMAEVHVVHIKSTCLTFN